MFVAILSEKYGLRVSKNFYHYTDINGFIGIIGRCEFWLSHLRYMNDTSEYIEGENICKNSIKKLCQKFVMSRKKFYWNYNLYLAKINQQVYSHFQEQMCFHLALQEIGIHWICGEDMGKTVGFV